VATRFDNLLDEFHKLPPRPERLKTFMEIAGCAHRENACSDILAFFFDPGRPHGLGDLFLEALAQVGGIQNQETMTSDVSVGREVTTKAGNQIDLLIRSDSHAILIENKIWASIDNPFCDYAAHLDSLKKAHQYKFLLTLKTHREDVGHGFKNITHEQLVKEIRRLLGDYVARADTRYLTLMLDFLNTLDNLQRGTVMDQEFVDFLKLRSGEVERFLNEMNAFKDELRKKVKELAALIKVKHYPTVRQWLYRERESLSDTLVHDIRLASGLTVAVDTVVSPSGWQVQCFVRKGDDRNQAELQKLLQRLEIPFEASKRFVLKERCKYAEDLGQIARVVQDIVCKLVCNDGSGRKDQC
jgi:hypothetical protein